MVHVASIFLDVALVEELMLLFERIFSGGPLLGIQKAARREERSTDDVDRSSEVTPCCLFGLFGCEFGCLSIFFVVFNVVALVVAVSCFAVVIGIVMFLLRFIDIL